MTPSSRLLLEFLSRPHTLGEVAERFGISSIEAESLVIKAVESGQLLISSRRDGRSEMRAGLPRPGRIGTASLVSTSSLGSMKVKLFHVSNSKFSSKIIVGKGGESQFKLRRDKPELVRRSLARLPASKILGRQRVVRKSSRISLLSEVRLLETLSAKPEKLDDLRATHGVSRKTIDGLVRKGLLCASWGPNGVGNFYGITQRGSEELRRLRTASTLGNELLKRRPISLKTIAPPMAR